MNTAVTQPTANNKRLYFFIFGLFFFSGMSGLIYQIVWTRNLVLIFGNTMLATSTVLSAFMAGLAAGSFVLGKYADKRPRGLIRVYALLEAGIGLFALLFPLLLEVVRPVYTNLYRALAGNLLAINLIRFGICFILIVVPTFLMGATLPVLIKRFVRGTQNLGRHVGLLYGLNTAGAVVGSLLGGFLLLRALGMRQSTLVAVAINFLVALLAWILGKEGPATPKSQTGATKSAPSNTEINPAKIKPGTSDPDTSTTTVKWVLTGIGISGFCALAYEVFWTRMLNLFFHNTVYSFTTMLATFLTGIALGSLIYSKFFSGISHKIRLFIGVEIGIGVFSYATPFVFNLLYTPLFSKSAQTFTVLQAMVIMIGPTLLMGIALPLAVQICQRGPQREGDSVGTVYAVNTIGSILGAFAAGFILLPQLGIHKSVIVVVGFNLLAGVLVLASLARPRVRWLYGVSFILLLVVSFIIAPSSIFRSLYQKKQPTANLRFYKEGKIANVVVYDFYKNGYKDFYLNGIEEASSRLWHVQLFKMLGSLPIVVHPQPDDALMVAFGAGMSAGAAIDLVNQFECAELNHDIFEEATYFKKENRDVIHNPKLNMVFNDGRNQLLLAPRKYSLIISDATNPLTFDSWTLYTKEFYELCRQKLKPGGVFCQWVPIPLPGDAIKVILKTFKTVFPHTSFWVIYGSSQCMMLATPERLQIDYRELSEKLPRVLKISGLSEYGVNSVDKFLSFFMLGEDELEKYLAGFGKINSDDLPDAQFHGGVDREGIQTSLEMLKYQGTIEPYLTVTGPEEEKGRVHESLTNYLPISRLLTMGFLRDNEFEYRKALAFAAAVHRADDQNIMCMLDYGPKRLEYFQERVNQYPRDANAHNSMGFILWKRGNHGQAIREFQQAIALNPDFVNARINLAHTYIDASQYDLGVKEILAIVEMNPTIDILNMARTQLHIVHLLQKLRYQHDESKLYLELANAYMEAGEIDKAIPTLQAASALPGGDPELLYLLSYLYETVELPDKALSILEQLAGAFPGDKNLEEKISHLKALQAEPQARESWLEERIAARKDPFAHPPGCDRAAKWWNKFDFEGKINPGNLARAAQEFEKVIEQDEKHMHAYADAATIYEYLKRYGKAAELWRRGLQVSPNNEIAENNIRRLELLEELYYKNPPDYKRVELQNEIGVMYWRNGEVERALNYFHQVLKEKPDHVMAWANLGANYIEAGKYREAIQALERALQLNPNLQYRQQMQERLQWLKTVVNPAAR
jgi:spermidine synthase